jgi:hypothetical protein
MLSYDELYLSRPLKHQFHGRSWKKEVQKYDKQETLQKSWCKESQKDAIQGCLALDRSDCGCCVRQYVAGDPV